MNYPIEILCKVMQVSRSGYYKWLRKLGGVTERQIKRLVLNNRIIEIYNYHCKRYGAIRIMKELKKEGLIASVKLVNKIMKANNLLSLHTKKYRIITTNSNPNQAIADNKLNRDFFPDKLNQVWAADVTYIKVVSGWIYLAVVLDLYNQKVVGYQQQVVRLILS